MKTLFVFLLIVTYVQSVILAQYKLTARELESARVFASQHQLSACDAISERNYLELARLAQAGLDLDERGEHGCTLLLWSWCRGYHHGFEALLEMGADPHATLDSDMVVDVSGNRLTLPAGSSVAAIAVRFGRVQPQFLEKVVRYLRDANQRDAQGRTLLHHLMASTDDQPIERQLRDVEQDDPKSLRLLRNELASMDAAKLLQIAPFALLYRAGVQVEAVDNANLTALQQYIVWLENSGLARPKVDLAASVAISLFQHTEYFKDAERRARFVVVLERMVSYLEGASPVLMTEGLLRTFRQSEQNQNVLAPPEKDRDLFGDYGHFLFVKMYRQALDEEVSMAIEGIPRISSGNKVRSFTDLREVGFDANAQGKAGITHLFDAYTAKNSAVFGELLMLQADPDVRLKEDLWPFLPAALQSSDGAAFCPERGETVLLSAALNPERVPYLQLAIPFSDEIDIRDNLNRNMLHRILYHPLPQDQRSLIDELVEAGVDVNAQSIGGATPCHEAVFRNAPIIPELVRLGADVSIRDLRGRTVSDMLRQSVKEKWTFHEESARALKSLERLSKRVDPEVGR